MLIAENIEGFYKLGVNADMFKKFIYNFYNAWGLEARETIQPISVKYKRDEANGPYLRFDYEMYGRKCWLHVTGPRTWY